MNGDRLSQAQAFWNRTKAAGWSDEQTRMQVRREAGVVHHGVDFIFADGSILRDMTAPLGRKLVVCEQMQAPVLPQAALVGAA
jgi:hypothetical protein